MGAHRSYRLAGVFRALIAVVAILGTFTSHAAIGSTRAAITTRASGSSHASGAINAAAAACDQYEGGQ
jgi:hypothetical protein